MRTDLSPNFRRSPWLGRAAAAVSLAALLGACATPEVRNPATVADLAAQQASPQSYVIGPGDTLDVKFFYNPELNDQVQVRPDGNISLQLVGEQRAAGMTPGQLEAALRRAYDRELKNAQVAVLVRGFATNRAYIDGEVYKPGPVDLSHGMKVSQAIAVAGGMKDTASNDKVVLVRQRQGAQPQVVELRLSDAMNNVDPSQDVMLTPSDTVFVPRSGVAELNRVIDQYIRKNIPVPLGLGVNLGGD